MQGRDRPPLIPLARPDVCAQAPPSLATCCRSTNHGVFYSPHRDLVIPQLLGLLGNKVRDLRLDVARGDRVGAGKADPFHSETLAYKYARES